MPNKQIQTVGNMTIELPADALSIIENGKNAYIHANGVVYRVIEESKYWEQIRQAQQQERQRVIEEVESWLVDEDSFEISKSCIDDGNDFSRDVFLRTESRNNLRAELRTKLNQMKGESK